MKTLFRRSLICMSLVMLTACATPAQNVAVGVAAGFFLGGQSPINEIEQIYYLGVFDPQGQLPPQVYRVRVHGQSSLGNKKFASGWVPASVIDTLNLSSFEDIQGFGSIEGTPSGSLETGRRLLAFGPEGFRKVPKDHRLVMVMGNNPDDFFRAVSTSLGTISSAKADHKNSNLNKALFEALVEVSKEKQRHKDLHDDMNNDKIGGGE